MVTQATSHQTELLGRLEHEREGMLEPRVRRTNVQSALPAVAVVVLTAAVVGAITGFYFFGAELRRYLNMRRM